MAHWTLLDEEKDFDGVPIYTLKRDGVVIVEDDVIPAIYQTIKSAWVEGESYLEGDTLSLVFVNGVDNPYESRLIRTSKGNGWEFTWGSLLRRFTRHINEAILADID